MFDTADEQTLMISRSNAPFIIQNVIPYYYIFATAKMAKNMNSFDENVCVKKEFPTIKRFINEM